MKTDWLHEPLRTAPVTTIERRGEVARPYPPAGCGDDEPETFVPAPQFAEWIRDTFLNGSGPLQNEDHAHLLDASLGVLWTNAVNRRQMRDILATAEIPTIQAGGWKRARHEHQLREWFGAVPDFLLTFYAPVCTVLDDRAFCALVEHELYHCAQQVDGYGSPMFSRDTGLPLFAMRGHDVEEFTGVVRRYGVTSGDVRELVAAANQAPLLPGEPIARACGACR